MMMVVRKSLLEYEMSESRKRNLMSGLIDTVLFIVFLVLTDPQSTGITTHEWVGLGVGLLVAVHLVRNWAWLVSTLSRLSQGQTITSKLSVVLNITLFVVFGLLVYTGIAISQKALPALGVVAFDNHSLRGVHGLLSNLTIGLIGAHAALHWNWIVGLFRGRKSTATVEVLS
jgi:cytochrome b561